MLKRNPPPVRLIEWFTRYFLLHSPCLLFILKILLSSSIHVFVLHSHWSLVICSYLFSDRKCFALICLVTNITEVRLDTVVSVLPVVFCDSCEQYNIKLKKIYENYSNAFKQPNLRTFICTYIWHILCVIHNMASVIWHTSYGINHVLCVMYY